MIADRLRDGAGRAWLLPGWAGRTVIVADLGWAGRWSLPGWAGQAVVVAGLGRPGVIVAGLGRAVVVAGLAGRWSLPGWAGRAVIAAGLAAVHVSLEIRRGRHPRTGDYRLYAAQKRADERRPRPYAGKLSIRAGVTRSDAGHA